MKKLILLMVSLVMLFSCFSFALADESEWTCPSCGATATGNFCSSCGERKPEEDGSWTCSSCGTENSGNFCSNCGAKRGESGATRNAATGDQIRLDLEIAFEKNAIFSTYDVKVFIDDELITTMRHGIDYAGTVYVEPGKHIIKFQEDGSSYPSDGSTVINVTEPLLYKCEIHAKSSTIQISGERSETISASRAAPGQNDAVKIDGNLKLEVSIEFRKNAIFSQYDVDMYCDDEFVATLPHGKNYSNTLLVSKGPHMIVFYKSGNKSVRGTCSFKVDKDASFSCKIEATSFEVEVRNDKLSY